MPYNSSIDVENPKQTIGSCFKMTKYVVPAFQREYVWEDTEIEQLLGDIESAFEYDSSKEYFLGTTVVYKNADKLQLIDGQQRMTTFFLILCAIAKKYMSMGISAAAFEQLINAPTVDADGNSINSYTLELQYEDSTKCLSNIWENNIPNDDNMDELPASSKRLYEAYYIINKRLNTDYTDFSDYKRFASYFISKVVFIQIAATNMADALKIFVTINQRGVTLNPLDLLKNMLFMQVNESQFERLNTKWKSMVDELESIKEKPLRFLRYYITATYDISDVKQDFQGIINEDDIYNWLSNNNDKCHYKEAPFQFTDDMINGLKRYRSYLFPDESVQGRDYLMNINALMGNSYRLHLVPLLSSKGMDNALRANLFKAFDLITYYSVVNNIKSNTLERLFSSWCPYIREISDKASFDNFINTKILPTINNWNLSYKSNFMTLSLNNMQKYKIKTILARICKYVDAYRSCSDDASDITEYLKTKNEVEHIMPVTCPDISKYEISEQEEYDRYKHLLGNLTLLEKPLNRSIQNQDYQAKVLVYESSTFYLTKSLNGLVDVGEDTAINRMNKKLSTWTNWNATSITERQEMLYSLTKEIWDITKL